jgi:hypothetical protein
VALILCVGRGAGWRRPALLLQASSKVRRVGLAENK